jgi:hypothetical protein
LLTALGAAECASRQAESNFSVIARFWDDKIDIDVVNTVQYEMLIPKKHMPVFGKTETQASEKVKREIGKLLNESKLQYKPPLDNIFITFSDSERIFKEDGYRIVGYHPNRLFTLRTKEDHWQQLRKASNYKLCRSALKERNMKDGSVMAKRFRRQALKIGTITVEPRPDDEENLEEHVVKNKLHFMWEHRGTETFVNKNKSNSSQGVARELSQNQVMGNTGANEVRVDAGSSYTLLLDEYQLTKIRSWMLYSSGTEAKTS